MDEHLYHDLENEIKQISLTVQGVICIEKCFIRKAGMKYHVDLHVIVDGNKSVKVGHDIAHNLKDTLRKELMELGHVLIHIEPNFESITL
jgi:divalent metal cation (Fe/Co/Zn/Cd) transporter